MTKILTTIVFLLVVFLVMFALHGLIVLARYPIQKRYLHCRYLVVYVLLLLIAFNRYTFTYVINLSSDFINQPDLINLWRLVMPERHYEIVFLLLQFLISNILLLIITGVLFLIIKFLFRRQSQYVDVQSQSLAKKILHFPWLFASLVYEADEESDEFHLTSKGFAMGQWAGWMKYIFLILMAAESGFLLFAIMREGDAIVDFAINAYKALYMLPIAGYLLVEQLQYFMEGFVEEKTGSFGSEKIEERLVGDLDILREIYQKTFEQSGALIGSYSWAELKRHQEGLVNNGVTNSQINDCEQPEILEMIANQLRAAGVHQSIAYQNAVVDLLNGRSINVRDYIQGEFLIYLTAYINFYVSQKETFLILVDDENSIPELMQKMRENLEKINRISSVWNIGDINDCDSNRDLGVLICTYNQLVSHKVVAKRDDFTRNLHGVVLADAMEFCSKSNTQNELIMAELRKINHKLQYIAVSEEDSDNLRTALEHFIDQELYLHKNDQLQNNMYVMIWKEDSVYKIQRCLGIGSAQSPSLGVSIPLALVGARYDLPRIRIFAQNGKAFMSYRDTMKMSAQEIIPFIGWNVNLEKMVQTNKYDMTDQEDLEMIILYDSEYNFYNLLWAWMKYGGNYGTMVHLVSPPYMLREYFAQNLAEIVLRSNQFEALVTSQAGLKETRLFGLLMEMCNAGVTEEMLMEKSREYGWNYANSSDLLEDCLKIVMSSNEFYNIYECFQFEEETKFDQAKDGFHASTVIRLTDGNVRRRVEQHLEYAKLETKHSESIELPFLRQNLLNFYLPGYVVPVNGYMYRIDRIADGTVFAEQSLNSDCKEYLQASEFVLKNMVKTDDCIDHSIMDYNMYTADAERRIYGYWEGNSQVAFTGRYPMNFKYLNGPDGKGIRVRREGVHVLQMRLKKEALGGKSREAVLLAGFMFRELFKTLFPKNYQNLYAVTDADYIDVDFWDRLSNDTEHCTMTEKVRSIVPFIRHEMDVKSEDEGYVNLYIIEFSALEMGMVSSLYAARDRFFSMLDTYLTWYLREQAASNAVPEPKAEAKAEAEAEPKAEENREENTAEEAEPKTGAEDKAGASAEAPTEEATDDTMAESSTEQAKQPAAGGSSWATYLNLGDTQIPSCFAPVQLQEFIQQLLPNYEEQNEVTNIRLETGRRCTFCGKPALFAYNLEDKRIMCRSCKEQQLTEKDEIKSLYQETVDFLQKTYHISISKNIHLRLHSADTIRRRCNIPENSSGRVLGFYQPNTRELWIESRGPKNAVQNTMIHELSHSWQFNNCDMRRFNKKTNAWQRLLILEGHTSYMEIDAMRKLGQTEFADFLESQLLQRLDEYGLGYRLVKGLFDEKTEAGSHNTPYMTEKEVIEHIDNYIASIPKEPPKV